MSDHATSGHTMTVTFDQDMVVLEPVCHEPAGAVCRLVCPKGCEEWTADHEHELEQIDFCNAVDWLRQGDIEEQCDEKGRFALRDGMPIEVAYEDWRGYVWRPVKADSHAS
jgi:hypothetical protein